MKIALYLLILPFLFLLPQCSPAPSGSGTLPKLTSPARARAWGSPTVAPFKNGYDMTYTNPSNEKQKLRIIGSRDLMYTIVYPPNVKGTRTINGVSTAVNQAQLWQKSLVLNETVKWYQSTLPTPEKAALFRSIGVELKNADGNKGNYSIEVEGSKNQMQTWLSELPFAH